MLIVCVSDGGEYYVDISISECDLDGRDGGLSAEQIEAEIKNVEDDIIYVE